MATVVLLRVQAFDVRHQPLAIDAPDDRLDETWTYEIPGRGALRFLHRTKRGTLPDGTSRLITYWIVDHSHTRGDVFLTRHGRAAVEAMKKIPYRSGWIPRMLPDLPRVHPLGCTCPRCRNA